MILPVMSPSTAVLSLAVICGFVLRVTVGYGLCLLVAQVATSAAVRFIVWLSFLFSATTYWLYCLAKIAMDFSGRSAPITALVSDRSGFLVMLSIHEAEMASRLLEVTAIVYVTILLLVVLAGIWKRMELVRALRYRTRPSKSLAEMFRSLSEEVRAPACDLWLLPGLSSPASMGWLKPAIYLPPEEVQTTTDLHAVLWHELSHVRRRDGLWEPLSRLCRWCVFFHPFVHTAFSSLRLERELACDALVVERNPEKRDLYADALVRFGWKTSLTDRPDHTRIGFTSRAAVLNARVKAILRGKQVYSKWSSGVRALLGTGACWMFTAVAPALWIGFGFPIISSTVRTSISPELHAGRQTRRRTHPVAKLEQSTSKPSNTAQAFSPASVSQGIHHEPRIRGFHVQNEQEPMSNPVAEAEISTAPDGGGSRGRGTAGKAALPSPSSVLNAVSDLARMGAGRDRDHGQD